MAIGSGNNLWWRWKKGILTEGASLKKEDEEKEIYHSGALITNDSNNKPKVFKSLINLSTFKFKQAHASGDEIDTNIFIIPITF